MISVNWAKVGPYGISGKCPERFLQRYIFATVKSQHCPIRGATLVHRNQAGDGQMYRTLRGAAAVAYLAGAFGFAYYDMLARANWHVVSVIEYGATWPLRLLSAV